MSEALGTWEQVFAAAAPPVLALADAARALIRSLDPAVVETARPGDGAVTFGLGPAKMRQGYAYLAPQKARLNLGFYHGADLPDPDGRLEGTGKGLRHVKLTDLPQLDAGIGDLLRAARADKLRRLSGPGA